MLQEVFYWVFNMSITATVTGIIVMLIGKIKRIPHRFAYILWIIPFLRMWLPAGLGSKYSLMSLISKVTIKTIVIYESTETFTMTNSVMAAKSYFPITYKINLLENLFNIASLIWIIISAAILIVLGVLYIITKRELRDALNLRDNIYLSDKVTSPAVYGIFHPKIILPAGFKNKELTYIIAHENAHIRNIDNLWRIIAFITVAFHWFNPFAWIFLKRFLIETELACDERVLTKFGESEKKTYALALVDCIENKSVFASAFGGAKIRVRIDSILSYKKLSFFSAICFIALAAAIAYVLLTNAL
jgi:beta-lactamase regulating signal transducer with metallopeptidase domain